MNETDNAAVNNAHISVRVTCLTLIEMLRAPDLGRKG